VSPHSESLQRLLLHAAENPLPADLIQSAMYSGESAGADEDQPYSGRGRPEPAHVRGHQGMDIDSAAAHRIPRGMFSSLMPVLPIPLAPRKEKNRKKDKNRLHYLASI